MALKDVRFTLEEVEREDLRLRATFEAPCPFTKLGLGCGGYAELKIGVGSSLGGKESGKIEIEKTPPPWATSSFCPVCGCSFHVIQEDRERLISQAFDFVRSKGLEALQRRF